uniref:Threonylcarbamoyl-AMP synthase n=1 Tax=Plectus sambesii TaxID=2011161 RepID=A0A914V150_9BILA
MAKIIPLSPVGTSAFNAAVVGAADVLKNGGIVAIPTDTVYGFTVTLPQSNKLYNLKQRSLLKPLGLCVADVADIHRYATVTISDAVLHSLLPGPVTLVFTRTQHLPRDLNPDTNLIGIRIPDHDFTRALCRQLGEPIAQTSANLSGVGQSPLSVQEFKALWTKIDMVIDGGRLSDSEVTREGSTVVDLSVAGFYHIVRPGCARAGTEELLINAGLKSL